MGGQEDGIYFLIQSRTLAVLVARDVIREIAEGLYFYADDISFRYEKHPPFFCIAHAVIRYTKSTEMEIAVIALSSVFICAH